MKKILLIALLMAESIKVLPYTLVIEQVNDTTAPASINDFTITKISSGMYKLAWTTTGDDGMTGKATLTEVTDATVPLNLTNFNQGTLLAQVPKPGTSGVKQSLTINLNPNSTHYFMVRISDEAGNSSLSNRQMIFSEITGDTSSPAPVADLKVTHSATGTIKLTWTAPGDDGVNGKATAYEIRSSKVPLNSGNYAYAKPVQVFPNPVVSGTVQSTSFNMSIDTLTYFMLMAFDDAGNYTYSNKVKLFPLGQNDTVLPAAIEDFEAVSIKPGLIKFNWFAPGDDGYSGKAVSYDIRYSTTPLNEINFSSGKAFANIPDPAFGGTLQSATVSLTLDTIYYFMLKTADDAGNISFSNRVKLYAFGKNDTIPPAAVTDFRVLPWTGNTFKLNWTAPGDDNLTGTAMLYEIYFSNVPLNELNYFWAKKLAKLPAPLAAGTKQSTLLTMNADTAYYFLIKTIDDGGNASFSQRAKLFQVPFHETFDKLICNTTFEQCKNNCSNSYWNLNIKNDTRWAIMQKDQTSNDKALQLTVMNTDTVCVKRNPNERTRSEIVLHPEHPEGSRYFYSWKFKIDANAFPDEITGIDPSSKNSGYYTIAQWAYDDDAIYDNCYPGSIPVRINYMPDANTNSKIRKLKLIYGTITDCKENYRELIIDSITKGDWNEIAMEIKWSPDPSQGYIRVWVNGNLYTKPGAANALIYGSNMYNDIHGLSVPNIFKMGVYRGHRNLSTQKIMFDDFQIGKTAADLKNIILPGSEDLEDPLSVVKSNRHAAVIYPNPADDIFYIRNFTLTAPLSIVFYNSLGQKITSLENSNTDPIAIPRPAIPGGLYFYVITDKNGNSTVGEIDFK